MKQTKLFLSQLASIPMLLLLAFLAALPLAGQAQPSQCLLPITPQLTWSKLYEGWIANDVAENRNAQGQLDGYVVVGAKTYANIPNSGGYPMLLKLDDEGNLLDSKSFITDTYADSRYYAVVQTKDANNNPDGFAFIESTGKTVLQGGGPVAKVIKVNNQLNIQWVKKLSGPGDIALTDLMVDDDGNLIAVGHTDVPNFYPDVLVVKMTTNGQIIWKKTYGSPGYDYAYGVAKSIPDGYIITGSHEQGLGRNPMLLHIDPNGTKRFYKSYGNFATGLAEGFAVTPTRNGFAFTGYAKDPNNMANHYPMLLETDYYGALIGDGAFGYNTGSHKGIGVGIKYVQNHASCNPTYLITGSMDGYAFTLHAENTTLTQWHPIENSVPSNPGFDPIYNTAMNGSCETENDAFILVGHTNNAVSVIKTGSNGLGNQCQRAELATPGPKPVWINGSVAGLDVGGPTTVTIAATNGTHLPLLCDPWENTYCYIKPPKDKEAQKTLELSHEHHEFSVYPNPNNGVFTISVEGPAASQMVQLFDLSGKKVSSFEVHSDKPLNVDVQELPKGLYIARTTTGQSFKINIQ